MNLIGETIEQIGCFNKETALKAKLHLESLAMPVWALGRIMDLAQELAGIKGSIHPVFKRKTCVVMAADHGVAEEGVSAYPQEVTNLMISAMLKGGAGINAVADSAQSKVIVVDTGTISQINYPGAENFFSKRVGNGTDNFAKGPAMTYEQAEKSIEVGIEIANELSNVNDIFGLGEVGIGNTTSATAVLCAITGYDPEKVTGRGTGINNESFQNKISVVKQALYINRPDPDDGIQILQKVGGFEIGAMAGFIIGAAAKGVPVIIDGFISTSSALLARLLCPNSVDFILASHKSTEPGHILMLKKLGKKAYLDLDLRLGEGTGAVMMMPLVDSACAVINNMFTLEQAMNMKC